MVTGTQGEGQGSMGKDSAGFTSANNGRWESGLSGRRHVGEGFIARQYRATCSVLDGLQALQAEDVLNVRRKIARCSRPPKMDIPDMPLTVQENKDKLLKNKSKGKEVIANTIRYFRR